MKGLRFVHKIILMPALATLGFAVVFATVQWGNSRSDHLLIRIANGNIPALEMSRYLHETLLAIQRGFQDAAGSAESGLLAEMDTLRDGFMARIREGKANPTLSSDELDTLGQAFQTYYALARDTTQRMIARESGDTIYASLERMRTQYLSLRESVQKLNDTAKKDVNDAMETILRTQRRSSNVLLIVTLLALGALAAVSFSVLRSITRPLEEVASLTRRLAQGDFSQRVQVESNDEMGDMAHSLNESVEKLAAALRTLGENSQTLSAAAEELTAISVEMASSAEQTAGQSETASSAAGRVNTSVQVVATGVEEMTASIREIARNAHQAAKVATEAVRVAETTHENIQKLGQSSSEISSVVKVITSIAEQTKLLALNATIEAARAGDAGRGFVVVANEVKELARATGKATEEISSMVGAIQADSGEAVTAIGQISSIIRQIYDLQNAIASAVEQQTATTNEIARNISDAARGSGEIADNISGVAKTAQLTSAGAASTKQSAAELARMADVLRALLSQFRA